MRNRQTQPQQVGDLTNMCRRSNHRLPVTYLYFQPADQTISLIRDQNISSFTDFCYPTRLRSALFSGLLLMKSVNTCWLRYHIVAMNASPDQSVAIVTGTKAA